MKTYEIERYELHTSLYHVTAENRGQAVAMLLDGSDAAVLVEVEDGEDYVGTCYKYGMVVPRGSDLEQELRSYGVYPAPGTGKLLSIKSIEELSKPSESWRGEEAMTEALVEALKLLDDDQDPPDLEKIRELLMVAWRARSGRSEPDGDDSSKASGA